MATSNGRGRMTQTEAKSHGESFLDSRGQTPNQVATCMPGSVSEFL